ncbi:hypothetical protein EX895_006349 [Sporisorium graminicola]|uniref:Uncharacterized protein n=1 Tax=Sporisorium graminicola TaxID=280036 RepID=A0A4V6YEL2_9BASI|nr:hypothetical protein EX895_006349 [Sporisorium graminicola]TKY85269.1 hypothetical protein EX895_006349 [Sporisorium graminicola]
MILPPFLQRWFLLNIIRLLTIVSCTLVIASAILTLRTNFQHYPPPLLAFSSSTSSSPPAPYYSTTDIPTTFLGVFWSTLNHVSLTLVLLTVLLSELSLPIPLLHRLFKNTLPFLGPNWGTGFLGVLLVLVAADALSRGDTGEFAEVSNWVLAITGVLNVAVGVVWRAKAKVVRSPMGWKRDVAEKLEKLAEAKANAERVVDALPLPTGLSATKAKDGGKRQVGKLIDLLGMAGKAVSKKLEERQANKTEQGKVVDKAQLEQPPMSIFVPPLPSAIVSSRAKPLPPASPVAVPAAAGSNEKTASPIPPPLIIPQAAATPPQSRTSTCSTRSTSSVYTLDIPPPNNTNTHLFSTPTPVLTTTDTTLSSPARPTLKTVRFHPAALHHTSSHIPSLVASTSVEVDAGGSRFLMLPSPLPAAAAAVMEGERSPAVLASLKAAMLEAQAKASAQPCKKSLYLGSTRWRAEYENLSSLGPDGPQHQEQPQKKMDVDRPYDFL